MKSANFPSVRVTPELREAAEQVLQQGESLSGFVEQAIREGVARRQARQAFIERGLLSRENAKRSGRYVSADVVLGELEKRLAAAKAGK